MVSVVKLTPSRFSSFNHILNITLSALLISFSHDAGCSTIDGSLAVASISLVFSCCAIFLSLYNPTHTALLYLRKFLVASPVFFYWAVYLVYTSRFVPRCSHVSADDNVRTPILVLASLQTISSVVVRYLSFSTSNLGFAVSGLAFVLSIVSVSLYYSHGGKTQSCSNNVTSNTVAKEEFMGIMWYNFVSCLLLTISYKISNAKMSSLLFVIGGTLSAVVVNFALGLAIESADEACPFLLESEKRPHGNAAMLFVLAAVASLHIYVPTGKQSTDDEMDSVSGFELESFLL